MEGKHRGWLRVLVLIVPYFIVVGVFQLIGVLISGADFSTIDGVKTIEQEVIIMLFSFIGTIFIVWLFVRYVDKEKFKDIGFDIAKRRVDIILGIVLGAVIMTMAYFLLLALDQLDFYEIKFNIKDVLLSVVLFILVSVTEEVLLRGYVLKNLMISFNKYVALIVSSLLFSLMHALNPNVDWFSLLNLFLAGILLGITYIHTKNLWFPIALHLSWNLFQSLYGFNVSGQDMYSIIEFKKPENNILNGGDFGFEGSIFSIIFQLIVIAGIMVYYKKKKNQSIVV